MNYKTRPGVVLTSICGSRFLIPTRSASEQFPHVIKLSFLTAICWSMIKSNHSCKEIYHAVEILTKKPHESVILLVDNILRELSDAGALEMIEEYADNTG